MPVMRLRVVWGLVETMAIFSPTRAFSKVDLPTFGRPTSAMKPDLNSSMPCEILANSDIEDTGET